MKVVKAFGLKDLRVVEKPDPTPREGEVLIGVRASGICGSDKWYWRVTGPTDNIAGHEVAGEVLALGPGVRHLKPGDRVAVNNVVGCGICAECRAGRFVRCANRSGNDVNNGFGELVTAPERNCMILHDSLDYEAGCLIFDNWGTPFAAIGRAGVKNGDDVVISGCGPIGLAAVNLSKMLGAYVIAVDPIPYRRDAAIRMGADAVLSPDDKAVPAINQLTNGDGASVVIECSGKGGAYEIGLSALRVGGTFVSVGENAQVDLKPSDHIIRKQLNVLGSWYTTMQQGKMVQDLMAEHRIAPYAFVTHRVTLERVPYIFGQVFDFGDNILKVVILMD